MQHLGFHNIPTAESGPFATRLKDVCSNNMPSFSYPVIPSDQLLWRQDPEISTMTKTEARTHVNNLFRQALSDNANQMPSASTIASFHLNHPVGRIELCYGMASPINRIGCWYAKVSR